VSIQRVSGPPCPAHPEERKARKKQKGRILLSVCLGPGQAAGNFKVMLQKGVFVIFFFLFVFKN